MSSNNRNSQGSNLRYCSFCGRNENQVNCLIPSPSGVYICDFCVEACNTLLSDTEEALAENGKLTMEQDGTKLVFKK